MRISSKVEYGMRALLDLAQRYGQGPIQSHDIHERQGIDEHYLNQILILLRRAGLIESIRGPQGGHRLARTPAHITVLDAFIALDGPPLPLDPTPPRDVASTPIDAAVVREVWNTTRIAIERELGAVTLDELCQRKRQRTSESMYYI